MKSLFWLLIAGSFLSCCVKSNRIWKRCNKPCDLTTTSRVLGLDIFLISVKTYSKSLKISTSKWWIEILTYQKQIYYHLFFPWNNYLANSWFKPWLWLKCLNWISLQLFQDWKNARFTHAVYQCCLEHAWWIIL